MFKQDPTLCMVAASFYVPNFPIQEIPFPCTHERNPGINEFPSKLSLHCNVLVLNLPLSSLSENHFKAAEMLCATDFFGN